MSLPNRIFSFCFHKVEKRKNTSVEYKSKNFKKLYVFLWLQRVFTAARGLSLVMASRGYSLVVMRKLLIGRASLVAEHRFQVHGLQQLWLAGSRVLVP